MHGTILLTIVLLLSTGLSFAQEAGRYPVIPRPAVLTPMDGNFAVTAGTQVIWDRRQEPLHNIVTALVADISRRTGFSPGGGKSAGNSIRFVRDAGLPNTAGYRLDISAAAVVVRFATDTGAYYAAQTLRQLMPPHPQKGKPLLLPAVKIEDYPRFVYRGVLLDVARHYFPVSFIKKYLDAMAFYKINTLHLHLNDDQGWRMESRSYPRLHQIGAWRKETVVGHRTDRPERFNGTPHGGYYTQAELKELVKYAGERFIAIVPEIDVPGHSQAILAAYPQFGCIDSTYTVSTRWGVHKDILCPKEETFAFLRSIMAEVSDIFPGKYIHIGGDEVPKDRWKQSAFCQELIRKLSLKDEHELQSYFIRRVEDIAHAAGKQIIGWDEILEGGLAPNATVMSWRGEKGGIAAARQHHYTIMTPVQHTYINLYQTSDRKSEPLSNGGFLPLNKIYAYNPVPQELAPADAQYILGTQACLWTEYVTNEADAEFMTFPRLCAFAETAWSETARKNYPDFLVRLKENVQHLKDMGMRFAPFFPEGE